MLSPFSAIGNDGQVTLRKISSHLSKCIVITLVSLTSCDIRGLSIGSVNCDVTSGQSNY